MQNQNKFQFPIITINKIEPLLYKGSEVYSYKIIATTSKGRVINLYENKGLNLKNYIGKKAECLLEITRGRFFFNPESVPTGQITIPFKYSWIIRPFEFFTELTVLKTDDHDKNTDEESITNEEVFADKAGQLFMDWGLTGLDIGIYQSKPLFISDDGFFLVNEYEFEDGLQFLELDETVHIRIDEVYLRGIKPVSLPGDKQQKKSIPQPQPKEDPKPQTPEEKQPPEEKKKSRFGFSLD